MATDNGSDTWIRVLVGGMVVFVAVILLATAVVVGVDSQSALEPQRPDRVDASASDPRPEGAGPTPTGDADVDSQLASIASFVERERWLHLSEAVTVEVLADAPFQDRLFVAEDKDRDDLTKQAQALQALGFVDSVSQVEQGQRALLEAGVLGFYDPESDELVVRGGPMTPMTRQTIAHELTHAVDDQWFDLDNAAYDENDDELGFGITAVLAEGNARRVDEAYAAKLDDNDKDTLQDEESQVSPPPASVPPILVSLITAPYDYGEPMVRALLRNGGQTRLDDAFSAATHQRAGARPRQAVCRRTCGQRGCSARRRRRHRPGHVRPVDAAAAVGRSVGRGSRRSAPFYGVGRRSSTQPSGSRVMPTAYALTWPATPPTI